MTDAEFRDGLEALSECRTKGPDIVPPERLHDHFYIVREPCQTVNPTGWHGVMPAAVVVAAVCLAVSIVLAARICKPYPRCKCQTPSRPPPVEVGAARCEAG